MRKIKLAPKPVELTEAVEKALVKEYSTSKKSVWRKQYIIDALLSMTYSKCIYSEAKLMEGGSYMEVDHFKPKEIYPTEVVHWGNLLPSSKTSNVSKGKTDPCVTPIINPLYDDPNDYLRFVGAVSQVAPHIASANVTKARNSIRIYALNSEQFTKQREKIIESNDNDLKLLREEIEEGVLKADGSELKRWKARYISVLMSAMPTEPYSTCVGQALKDNKDFIFIIQELGKKGMVKGKIASLLKQNTVLNLCVRKP